MRACRTSFNEAAGKSPRNLADPHRCGTAAAAASMRPRGSPRGIVTTKRPPTRPATCFNEAAGKSPRNRAGHHRFVIQHSHASMRPRGSPRGIDLLGRGHGQLFGASMRPRGSPRGIVRPSASSSLAYRRFNEAAGKSPRNPRRSSRASSSFQFASMRPRGSPRGIGVVLKHALGLDHASMRPRGSPRGINSAAVAISSPTAALQ